MIEHDAKLKRELSICQKLANGMTRIEIAKAMNRTRSTVDQIMVAMMRRHNVITETALIAKLMKEGWVK